jgi:flavin-dependent dehydrogenase
MSDLNERYDVVVLGSGLGALCLTRLLEREAPAASVLTVDKAAGVRRKVGESTVEIGAHFLSERLGLADVIARTQLPKNGLRFWFDDADHTLTWAEASEDGPGAYSHWRSVQIERDTFEASLLELNRAGGATHLFGAKKVVAVAQEGANAHQVSFELDGVAHTVKARWLVDATGVASLLGRSSGNLVPEARITHSACWTWFKGAKRIDAFVPNDLRRFSHGPRCISTNLLLNEGYWIWLIPLASGLLSVGIGYDHTVVKDPPKNREELVAFLLGHAKLGEILGEAEALEFGVLKNFSTRPEHYFTADRVAWLGMAAGFVDPFFSNGIDLVALTSESVADLVRRDLAGGGVDEDRLRLYGRTLELVYEHFVHSIAKLFPTFASRELSTIRYRRDVHVYWDVFVWTYLAGRILDVDHLPQLHALAETSLERTQFFSSLMRHAAAQLKGRGALYRDNKGQYTFNQLGFRGTPYVRFEQQLGHAPDLVRGRRALEEIDAGCFLALLDVLYDADRSPLKGLLFRATDAVFPQLLGLHTDEGDFTPAFWTRCFELLSDAFNAALEADGFDLPRIELTPETFRKAVDLLIAAAGDDAELATAVRRRFNAKPELTDFSDLPPSESPAADWSVDHTPWLDEVPDFRSVYDILGVTWWDDPKTPFSALGKFAASGQE